VSLAAISNARTRMVRRLRVDQKLRARVEVIARGLHASVTKDKLED
jgi:hypothetical protein